MRPAVIAVIGLAAVIGIFVIEEYLPSLVFALNCFSLALVLLGTLIPATTKAGRLVLCPPDEGEPDEEGEADEDEALWPCLGGKRLNPALQHSLDFYLVFTRASVLGVGGILSLAALGVVLSMHREILTRYTAVDGDQYFFLQMLCAASLLPFAIAGDWFLERLLLVRSAIAIGFITPGSGSYTFVTHQGERHGGMRRSVFPDDRDTVCVVFYLPTRAQTSISSSGLRFHRLMIR
jgi:hypothetical protein